MYGSYIYKKEYNFSFRICSFVLGILTHTNVRLRENVVHNFDTQQRNKRPTEKYTTLIRWHWLFEAKIKSYFIEHLKN